MISHAAMRTFLAPQVVCMPISQVSKEEAGAILRHYRESLGMTQEQVIDLAGIPTITQLSEYETGKVSIARSKYLPKLAAVLKMSEEDVRAINPSAVFETPAGRPGPPIPPVVPFRETRITIPRELLEMVEKHKKDFPVLATERMQRMLAAPRAHGGSDVGPQTAEDWFDYWMANKRFLT